MIVYFSGTGNSRYVARLFAEALDDEMLDAAEYMKSGRRADVTSEKSYVFVSPTYAWRLPRVFERFIREGTFAGARTAYFVLTCGDGVGRADYYAAELCREKDMACLGLLPVVMPENYLALYDVPGDDHPSGGAARDRRGHRARAGAQAVRAAARQSARPCAEPRHQSAVLPLRRHGAAVLRHRRVRGLRAVRGRLSDAQHRFVRRQAALGKRLHPLHGLHHRLSGSGHRVRPPQRRAQSLSLPGARRGRGLTRFHPSICH